jgi:acetyltransferase-like isoleucine patch superfamily enzyme
VIVRAYHQRIRLFGYARWFFRTRIVTARGVVAKKKMRLDKGVVLRCSGHGQIVLGGEVEIERGCILESRANLMIGDHTFVGHYTTIASHCDIRIGRYCLIAEHVSIRDNNHRFERLDIPIQQQGESVAPVVIGDDVWIGAKATITPGVAIGNGAVVGANAVVTRDIPPLAIAVGAPARVIRYRKATDQVAAGRPVANLQPDDL